MSEPVAYINVQERTLEWATPMRWETPTVVKMDKVPLYTAPPQHEYPVNFIDALKFHTAMQELEPEPVAWYHEEKYRTHFTTDPSNELKYTHWKPLFTAPPQREWVDLTREEFAEILCDERWQRRPELMLLEVQAKLKEKNT